MDQRKLMDNANTITDMAKVRELALTRGTTLALVKLDGILQREGYRMSNGIAIKGSPFTTQRGRERPLCLP